MTLSESPPLGLSVLSPLPFVAVSMSFQTLTWNFFSEQYGCSHVDCCTFPDVFDCFVAFRFLLYAVVFSLQSIHSQPSLISILFPDAYVPLNHHLLFYSSTSHCEFILTSILNDRPSHHDSFLRVDRIIFIFQLEFWISERSKVSRLPSCWLGGLLSNSRALSTAQRCLLSCLLSSLMRKWRHKRSQWLVRSQASMEHG